MIDPLAWGAIVVPTLAVGISAWVAGRHNRKASDHATDSSTLVNFNHQLLEFIDSIGVVKTQVTNGHKTNLRDDLSKAIEMVIDLKRDMRLMRAEVNSVAGDVRDLQGNVNALERRVIESGEETSQ